MGVGELFEADEEIGRKEVEGFEIVFGIKLKALVKVGGFGFNFTEFFSADVGAVEAAAN